MITSVLIHFRHPDLEAIERGIRWILEYQFFELGTITSWKGSGIQKYGGCLRSTPCYIGLSKSCIALSDYVHADWVRKDLKEEASIKLQAGLGYILDHQVYVRESKQEPITKDITKLAYPFTYKVNVLELLRLLRTNDKLNDPGTAHARTFIRSKQKKDGFWRALLFDILRIGFLLTNQNNPLSGFLMKLLSRLPKHDEGSIKNDSDTNRILEMDLV